MRRRYNGVQGLNFMIMGREGHLQIVDVLVKYGANIHFVDSQGYNSLHLAVHGKQSNMLLLLLALNGNIDSRDSFGRTPLMWAAYSDGHDDLITVLLGWGANTDLRDVTGYTALHWAVVSSNFYHGKLLIEANANQDILDEKNKTARDWAVERKWTRQYDEMIVSTKASWFTKKQGDLIMYGIPMVVLPVYFYIFAYKSIYFSLPVILVSGFVISRLIEIVLANNDSNKLMNSPIMASVLQSSMLWAFVKWVWIFTCI